MVWLIYYYTSCGCGTFISTCSKHAGHFSLQQSLEWDVYYCRWKSEDVQKVVVILLWKWLCGAPFPDCIQGQPWELFQMLHSNHKLSFVFLYILLYKIMSNNGLSFYCIRCRHVFRLDIRCFQYKITLPLSYMWYKLNFSMTNVD